MNKEKTLTMLGFAAKAGKIVSGEMGARASVHKNKAKLMMIATDAAESTKEEFLQVAEKNGVTYISGLSMKEMGMAIGKSNRSILIVLDEGFAYQIRKNMDY